MLVPALLQTSLVLWLAQQTLQGGVKPQSVSWGRVLPARGVGVGVKPGVAGALGALGNRYGSKAMKTGLGHFTGAHLGAGGYRSLGLGGRTGLRQGAYGAQGGYGAGLGAGMPLGTGFANGLGLGQGGRRVYGAGLGTVPGYGALGAMGYPGARPGIGLGYPTGQRTAEQIPGASAADLGGPELASLGQAAQDLKSQKSRAMNPSHGRRDGTLGPELPIVRDGILGPAAPELQTGADVKSLHAVIKSSSLGSATALDKPSKNLGLGEIYDPTVLERKSTESHAAAGGEGARHQLPYRRDNFGIPDSSRLQSARDYDLSFQQSHRNKNCGSAGDLSHLPEIDRHELLGSERTQGLMPKSHLGKEGKHLGQAAAHAQGHRAFPLPLSQTQDARGYLGGAGNYLGAGLGNGGYGAGLGHGAGLGQGAYLGGAAGKLAAAAALGQGGYPQGGAGYGDGVTGYLGAGAGNVYGGDAGAKALAAGYGNGYSDGYGAGLGYPAELADGAQSKAGKRKALSTGGYAGQVQGAYGALGAGMESTGGKYGGGAAQVPYGNAPVIPTGLEGDGGYPYSAQSLSLSADGAKTANKYGYGAQMGAAQEALGEQQGKYGGVNGGHGKGYKG